jgi:hypothetical protein
MALWNLIQGVSGTLEFLEAFLGSNTRLKQPRIVRSHKAGFQRNWRLDYFIRACIIALANEHINRWSLTRKKENPASMERRSGGNMRFVWLAVSLGAAVAGFGATVEYWSIVSNT